MLCTTLVLLRYKNISIGRKSVPCQSLLFDFSLVYNKSIGDKSQMLHSKKEVVC